MNQAEAMDRFGVRGRAKWAQLVKEGMPRKPMGRGYSYDEGELAAWFAARDADEDDGIPADYREMYAQERAKKTKAERELREIKLAEERGELVRTEVVQRSRDEGLVRLRSRLMRVPAEAAAACYTAGSELEVEEVLRKILRAACEELAADVV